MEVWCLKSHKRLCKRINKGHNLIKVRISNNNFFTGGTENNELRMWKI